MKKILISLCFLVFLNLNLITAGTLNITNSSSDEITINVQTGKQNYTQTLLANENQIVNTLYNSVLKSLTLTYDNTPIEFIIINRLSTTTPQIICNTDSVSTNSSQKPIGLYAVNIASQGSMNILQDTVTLQQQVYELTDLSSCITYCKNLQQRLALDNLDTTEKKITTLTQFITKVNSSDKASDMQSQIAALQLVLQNLSGTVAIIKNLQKNIQTIDQATNQLTSSNAKQAKKTLHAAQNSLKAIMQTPLQKEAFKQTKILQTSMNKLIQSLNQLGFKEKALYFEMLVPYEQEISAYSMQVNEMMQSSDMVKN